MKKQRRESGVVVGFEGVCFIREELGAGEVYAEAFGSLKADFWDGAGKEHLWGAAF